MSALEKTLVSESSQALVLFRDLPAAAPTPVYLFDPILSDDDFATDDTAYRVGEVYAKVPAAALRPIPILDHPGSNVRFYVILRGRHVGIVLSASVFIHSQPS